RRGRRVAGGAPAARRGGLSRRPVRANERRRRRSPDHPSSHRVVPEFARADPHEALEVDGPDLAVADLARPGGVGDEIDDLVGLARVDDDLDLYLGNELGLVLGAAEDLRLAALAPEALDLGDREAADTGGPQGLFDVLQLEGLDDGGDQVGHGSLLLR